MKEAQQTDLLLTDWFSFKDGQKPWEPGVYNTRQSPLAGTCSMGIRLDPIEGYSYWDGEKWGMQQARPDQAKPIGKTPGWSRQDKDWRGLAQPAT